VLVVEWQKVGICGDKSEVRVKSRMAEWRDKEATCKCGHKAMDHGRRSRTCKENKCECIRFIEAATGQAGQVANTEYMLRHRHLPFKFLRLHD